MRRIVVLLLIGAACALAAIAASGIPRPHGSGLPEQGLPAAAAPNPNPAPVPQTEATPVPSAGGAQAEAPATTPAALPVSSPSAAPGPVTPVPVSPAPPGATPAPAAAGATPSFPVPPGPAPGDPYTITPSDLAARIHDLINRQRAENGLGALGSDPALAAIALGHSVDMAAGSYFAHVDPRGRDPTARGVAAGYTCRKDYGSYYTYGIAENIFQNNRYSSVTYFSDGRYEYDWNSPEEIAETTVGGWMNSTGHRKNILTAAFDREGIGVAIAADDKVYITEDFC